MIECPYCHKEFEYDNSDGFSQDDTWEQECPHCGKLFMATGWYVECFSSKKADCLNGSEHTMEMTHTIPKRYRKMRCTGCGHEEPLQEETS